MHEGLNCHGRQSSSVAVGVHVFLEIFVHILKDEHEFVLSVNDIVERDDILMFELFHERDFADGSRRCPFFRVEVNFFQGDEFACLTVATFEDLMTCSFSKLYYVQNHGV